MVRARGELDVECPGDLKDRSDGPDDVIQISVVALFGVREVLDEIIILPLQAGTCRTGVFECHRGVCEVGVESVGSLGGAVSPDESVYYKIIFTFIQRLLYGQVFNKICCFAYSPFLAHFLVRADGGLGQFIKRLGSR